MLEELVENPEKFRVGPNFRATHVVFPVEFKGKKYIVKRARALGAVFLGYYWAREIFQDSGRVLSTASDALAVEAEKLRRFYGMGLMVPKLVAYENGVIFKSYIRGRDFRSIEEPSLQKRCIQGSIETLFEIHRARGLVGGVHIKNSVLADEGVYFVDFDGVFDSSDSLRAQAREILALPASVLHVTRSKELASYTVQEIKRKYARAMVYPLIQNMLGE